MSTCGCIKMTLILLISWGAVAAGSGQDLAHKFDQQDKNQDGMLDRSEWRGSKYNDGDFKKYDKNGDDFITREEYDLVNSTGKNTTRPMLVIGDRPGEQSETRKAPPEKNQNRNQNQNKKGNKNQNKNKNKAQNPAPQLAPYIPDDELIKLPDLPVIGLGGSGSGNSTASAAGIPPQDPSTGGGAQEVFIYDIKVTAAGETFFGRMAGKAENGDLYLERYQGVFSTIKAGDVEAMETITIDHPRNRSARKKLERIKK